MASGVVFKKPTLDSQLHFCGESRIDTPQTDDDRVTFNSSKLLGEIERLFNDDDDLQGCEIARQAFYGFTVGRFGPANKFARRHTFQTLSPSSEWFKLSPKSKFQRKLKKSTKFYRNKSDSLLLHEGLCTLRKLPLLHSPVPRRSSIRTPADPVQRQLFTPDSGYSSSTEYVFEDVFSSTPRIPKRHVIGEYVGTKRLDIVGELLREVPEVVHKILGHLSDNDLLSFAQVSWSWNSALAFERKDNRRRVTYLRKKQNAYFAKKENMPQGTAVQSRTLTHSAALFGDIQPQVAATPERRNRSSGLPSSLGQGSRHEEFWQSKKNLKDGASQMKCRCGSPAPVDSSASRAKCSNCLFDFCTNCKSSYHGNKPCRTPSRVRGDGVLTPKSRRNLRRL